MSTLPLTEASTSQSKTLEQHNVFSDIKSKSIPKFLPSLTMGIFLGPLQVLVTNPISKLHVKVINHIHDHSLDTWQEKLRIGLSNPFTGTMAGIISNIASNALVFGLRPIIHSITPYFFPGHELISYTAADICTGAITGAILSAIVAIRVRQQFFEYSSIWETIERMRRENISFFASAPTHSLRNAIHNGVFFPLSHVLNQYRDRLPYKVLQRPGVKILTNSIIGFISTLIAARIAYPLHIITIKQKTNYDTALNIVCELYRSEGLSAFGKGFWQFKLVTLGISGAMVNIATPIFNRIFDRVPF